MSDVVGVDHHRRQLQLEFFRELQTVERLDEGRRLAAAEGLDHLHHELAAAHQRGMSAGRLAARLQPGVARMAAPMRVGAHVGRPTKPGDAVRRDGRAVAGEVDLQRRADEQVGGVEAGDLAVHAVRGHRAVATEEIHVRPGAHVGIHAHLGAETVDLLHPARLDRRDQGGVRVQREMRADLALEAGLLRIGRQQQLDGGGVEADPVVQPFDTIRRINALDRHHGHQDLRLGDLRRVAGEQRLDVERARGLDDEVDPVAWDVDARQLVDDLVHLRDDDALLEGRRLDHDRRILDVGTHVEIAVSIGLARHRHRDLRRQVHEVAAEKLDVGVDRAELDLAAVQCPRHRLALRTRIGIIELGGDALFEQIEMLGEHDAGLDDVEVMDLRLVDLGEGAGEEVGLLLVVAFEAHPITGPDDRLHQLRRVTRGDDLALGELPPGGETLVAVALLRVPFSHAWTLPRPSRMGLSRHKPLRYRASTSSLALMSRGFQDQVGDLVGVRDQGEMSGIHLDRLRAHSLGHEAFESGIYRPIVFRDGIEARLRVPGGDGRLAGQQRLVEGLLDGVEDLGFRLWDAVGEVAEEGLFLQSAPVAFEDDTGRSRRLREALGQRRIILARVGRACRDVDERRDVRRDAGLRHDHAGEGMADEDGRTILSRQHALGGRHRVVERRQRVLHRGWVESLRLQTGDHLGPAGAVREQAMDQDDIAYRFDLGPRGPRYQCGKRAGCQQGRKSAAIDHRLLAECHRRVAAGVGRSAARVVLGRIPDLYNGLW